MKYSKPALTREQQADLLISRGMISDRDHIISQLSAVNYYRLSGCWHTFRLPMSHDFSPNTTFEKVWTRYVFDRRLRLCVMDALERLEVYFRGQLAYHFAHEFNCPFAYADDPAALPNLRSDRRNHFLRMLADDLSSSKEVFVEHFRSQYGHDHPYFFIYGKVFPEHTVIPCGSCELVIHAACSFTELPSLHHNKCGGLVDSDVAILQNQGAPSRSRFHVWHEVSGPNNALVTEQRLRRFGNGAPCGDSANTGACQMNLSESNIQVTAILRWENLAMRHVGRRATPKHHLQVQPRWI